MTNIEAAQSTEGDAPAEPMDGPAEIVIDANLSPANADAVRLQAISTLEAARGASVPVSLDVSDDDTSLTALQLLVGVVRSAERDDLTLETSDTAAAVLAGVEHDRNEGDAE